MASSLIDTYCTHLQAEGKSPHTIRWHVSCLNRFTEWLGINEHSVDPNTWTPALVRSYLVSLQKDTHEGQPLSAHTIRSYFASLRCYCRWLLREEYIDRDVMERVRAPKTPKLVKATFTTDEIKRLLSATRDWSRNDLRDEALILFMLDTGARANEVCSLTLADVNWSQRLAKLFGKGAKERYVPFSAPTMKAVQRFIHKSRRGLTDRLFESEEGRPLTPSGLYQALARRGKLAGVEVNPHKFRHTFAISYLRNGASVFALQKTLGHTTLDMTLRYSALMTDDLVSEHMEHSPVAALLSRR